MKAAINVIQKVHTFTNWWAIKWHLFEIKLKKNGTYQLIIQTIDILT